jgi:glycosyltransferase involved in cell wall biosynthesis
VQRVSKLKKGMFKTLKARTVFKKNASTTKLDRTPVTRIQELSITDVGVVIPTLNEEKNIEEVLLDLKNLGYYDILVIDGRSMDETTKIAKNNGAKVVLQNGKGKGNAIKQALSNGYLDADAIVMMDADGSMDPKEIIDLVEILNSGADIVKGSRFLKTGYSYDMSSLRRIGNMLMVTLVNLLWSAKYTDLCYGFAVFNRRAIEKLVPLLESQNFEIETEIFLKALDLGLVVKEVPSTEFKRKNGESNLNSFRDGFKILKTIAEEFVNSLSKKNVSFGSPSSHL